ncbi:endoplasmic reticulum metallopeptidase 1-like [Cylas formicarius]|uniref:endoplasmic reticulum metallopeptidase 1-like n=1 Tax=Cylas formicarius TaxID=197179 RepID=UPI0029587C98|nr:endoplasmic reticulum metallopeptidase 1-like [Cylas formicarius]XP_060528872.1 endoplasmic reticulum metallopeptidase 1-like [Cylas formicarius]XP_060528881.1 endoplasmic reticulum metallopeptidase 1-like [Cylas formicarius]XP_060528888.1 endoplasmic reticulum metallopeptidase 1-like [Cylas formicarius]
MPSFRYRFQSETPGASKYSQYDDEKPKFHRPMPASHFMGVMGLIVVVFALVIIIEKQLPAGLKLEDEPRHPDSFIAERAYNVLKNLTSIGPRIAGSYENEVIAVKIITGEIEEIMRGANRNNVVELDIQKASGAFNLEFLDGMTNVYRDVQNIVVKVGSKINSRHSLLINCHFDSVVDSPGGSDDGASCAVMLEILRVLVRSEKILRHNIIFLFNGGEENFMPASHGFITQHKWAKEVRAFINLEACGAGGREVLFQAGPNHPWILETYSEEVPYPYASSLAQEIFQSGVIPGDTDYRIFRDFGNISGLDFAWSANGYVYHTKFDTIEQIPLGSLQRTGDNILALAKGMAQGHQLANVEQYRAGNLVFFDFLGAFVIRWPMATADVINTLSVIFSFYCVFKNAEEAKLHESLYMKTYARKLLFCGSAIVASWVLSVAFGLLTAALINGLGRSMSWYCRPLWAFFLYVIPSLVISLITILLHAKYYNKDLELSPWTVFQLYYDAYQTIWTLILFVGIVLRIRSSFIALTWVFFASLGNILKTLLFGRWRDSKWILLHILVVGLPFVQSFYLIIGALYLFIPIMGRAGAGSHAEFLIAVMVSVLFAMLFSFAVPLILLVKKVDRIFSLLIGLFLISLAFLILTPLGFPYSGDPNVLAPQRFMMAHTKRTFHDVSGAVVNESGGYWIADMDVNSPHTVDRHVPLMRTAKLVREECDRYLYCGLPYLVPVLTMIWKTHWVPGPEPVILTPVSLNVKRQKTPAGQRIFLEVHGPTHIGVMFSPVRGVKILNWSLPPDHPLAGPSWQGRDTYFIYYAYGLDPVPLNFSIDFEIPPDHIGPVMDLAVTSHYLFGKGKTSKHLSDLVVQFPSWSAVTYWTASYESWVV